MLKNVRIGYRLALGAGFPLLLLLVGGGVVLYNLGLLRENTEALFDHPLKVRTAIREVNIKVEMAESALNYALLRNTPENVAVQTADFRTLMDEASQAVVKVREHYLGDLRQVEALSAKLAQWRAEGEQILSLAAGGQNSAAAELCFRTEVPLKMEVIKAIDPILRFALAKSEFLVGEVLRQQKTGAVLVYWIFGLVFLFSLAFVTWNALSITRPLKACVDAVEQIAHGRLNTRLPDPDRRDEIGRLIGSVARMTENLRSQIAEIQATAGTLALSAAEISATTTQFAASFPEVATAVNQTVTSMREIKQTAQLSNDKSAELLESARNVASVSQTGARSVGETVETMNRIQENMTSIAQSIVNLSEQAQSISEIISAVEDLAEQSRLLAVNAAIEAVKAGEQGKGFSVVAAEIKGLADQSKVSTTQVRTILTEIQRAMAKAVMVTEKGGKAVEKGVAQAGHSGESIQVLAGNIADTAGAVVQIEATSRQQLVGIDQVFAAMESVNTAMSQNAAGVRQLQTEARNLESLGLRLKDAVNRYAV